MYRLSVAGSPLFRRDSNETSRIIEQHELHKLILDGNYRGPVRSVLSQSNRSKRALDIGSNSPWLEEMAVEFPHVKWTGLDFFPPRYYEPSKGKKKNVNYEVYDYTRGLRYEESTFDLVHCRGNYVNVPNYPALILEISRILRPGGLFLWADTQFDIFLTSRTNPITKVPNCVRTLGLFKKVCASQGVKCDAIVAVPSLIARTRGFRRYNTASTSTSSSNGSEGIPNHSIICVPNGTWDRSPSVTTNESRNQLDSYPLEIGLKSRQCILTYLNVLAPIFEKFLGMTEDDVHRLSRGVHEELSDGGDQEEYGCEYDDAGEERIGARSFHHYHTVWCFKTEERWRD